MLASLDVHYSDGKAHAAAVVFDTWVSDVPIAQYTAMIDEPGDYVPGQFYLRELKPLLAVIDSIAEPIDTFIIDGYCHLSSELRPGLGAFLKDSLARDVAIVGVAKNRYRDTTHAVELLRARSSRPLFVTAIGMGYDQAAQRVAEMHGEFRIPTMLKAVDRLARS